MKKIVTFTVKNDGSIKTARVNIASIKKTMNFDSDFESVDSDFESDLDVYARAETRAVEKMYGKGRYFMQDNSGIEGIGQIWRSSPSGGSDSVTGIINIDSDFFE